VQEAPPRSTTVWSTLAGSPSWASPFNQPTSRFQRPKDAEYELLVRESRREGSAADLLPADRTPAALIASLVGGPKEGGVP
jgi:hypothetical protein